MKRIVFVDDEPNVLQGLKRMLRSMRKEWEMSFADSAEAALAQMKMEHFDVVVSDMRMPGMDGAQLLTEVARLYPDTVRIVLSGHSEKEAIFKAIGKTHQYLAKPCDAETVKQTVSRACALRDLLGDDALKSIASQMDHMPSLPEIYMELVEELKEDAPSLSMISRLISKDMAMTAKILQLVNSAFFGLRRRVTTVDMAVNYLGLENVSSLVLAANIFGQFDRIKRVPGFSMETLWGHSGQVGRLSQALMKIEHRSNEEADDAMTAGLLHDCGQLIFASNLPDEYERVLKLAKKEGMDLEAAEQEIVGASHGVIGAYLLGVWGLPDTIVEAVAYHHLPSEFPAPSFSPLTAVHVADRIAMAGSDGPVVFDDSYLESIGMEGRTEEWVLSVRKG